MKWNNFRRALCGALSATLLLSTSGLAFDREEMEAIPSGEEASVFTQEAVAELPMAEEENVFVREDGRAALAANDTITVSIQGAALDQEGSDDGLPAADYLARLVETPENTSKDVNFIPDTDKMAAGETWFEYDYGKEVKINGVSMVGWWPGAQGVKEVSFRYYDGENWQDGDANVTVPWGVDASVNGPISISFDLSQAVTCSRFRIVVNGTYTAWSSKCCMRSMAPRLDLGAQVRLSEAIDAAREALDGAAVGDAPYQYSQDVYDAFSAAIQAAQDVLDGTSASDAEYAQAVETLEDAQKAFLDAVNLPGTLNEPEITLHGLTTSGNPQTLVSGTSDFDFYSGADTMTDAYFEYNYVDQVKIYSMDLLGWWPKSQAVRTLSFSYYADGAWHEGGQDVTVPWKSAAGSNGASEDSPDGEWLTMVFSQPMECTKLRVYVTSAYHAWSNKVCMRHMEPRGEVIKEIKPLYDAIRAGQKYVDGVLVGSRPGEFPQAAVDQFQVVVSQAISALDQPDLTEAELLEQMAAVDQGLEILIQSQNPRVDGEALPEVSLEEAEAAAGTPFCLADRQLATRLELRPSQGEGSILLEYGQPYTLSSLTLIADQPLASAVKRAKLQHWDGSEWQEAGEWTLAYRGTVPNFEGVTLALEQPVTALRFRLVLLEGYGDTYVISELLAGGTFAVDRSALEETVQRAETVLSKTEDKDRYAVDNLRWKLASATNEDFLKTATQDEIDVLRAALENAISVLVPDDASLSELSLSAGSLTPAFDPAVYEYTASVSNSVAQVKVTAVAAQAGAAVAVKQGDTVCENGDVMLNVGENIVTIQITSGAAAKTYTVTITRASSGGSGTGGSSSGSNRPTTPTDTITTETRDDGAKVTTVTKPDGTVTETVEQPDGSKSETVTAKDGSVTITVTDSEGEEVAKVEIPATIPEAETRFEDVPVDHWADKAIHNAAALKLVNGVGGNKYDMVSPMTRGQLATVLHRFSQGKTDYDLAFKDVNTTQYYAPGIAWAAKAKVITGYTADVFGPEDIITREQLAVMLCRYAKLIGMDITADEKSLDKFVDSENIGSWVIDGVAWCVENGILKGKGENNLDTAANVTRAEVAVMLDRFIGMIK